MICLGLLAAPALADTRIERDLSLEPGGRLILETDLGSVTVTGKSGSGASVLITSTRDDLESVLDFDFQDDGGEVPGDPRWVRRAHDCIEIAVVPDAE